MRDAFGTSWHGGSPRCDHSPMLVLERSRENSRVYQACHLCGARCSCWGCSGLRGLPTALADSDLANVVGGALVLVFCAAIVWWVMQP